MAAEEEIRPPENFLNPITGNMEEFLSNIWRVEEEGFGSPGRDLDPINQNPSQICAEEVWAGIHRNFDLRDSQINCNGGENREAAMGEMTLEDFLIKVGVVREHIHFPAAAIASPANGIKGSAMGVGGYGGMQLGMVRPTMSLMSPEGMIGGGNLGRNGGRGMKRSPEGAVEVVVERRQRRMIKNRESAARSRARKQAYTVELEAELSRVKEENARLIDEEEKLLEMRKQMFLEAMAKMTRLNTNKACIPLRRCNSSPS